MSFSAFSFAIAEVLLEDVADVGHEIDRVVPDDRDPWPLDIDVLVGLRALDLDGRAHSPVSIVAGSGA